MVVLDRSDWLAWLDLSRPEAELLRPLPAGSLFVEQVRRGRTVGSLSGLCRVGMDYPSVINCKGATINTESVYER
jgi:hypothetical protein